MEAQKRTEAKENQEFIIKQIAEKQKLKDEAKEVKRGKDKIDIDNQCKRMEETKKNADEDFMKAKQDGLDTLKDSREIANRTRLASEKTNNEMDIMCEMFRDTKTGMDCSRQLMKKKDMEKTMKEQEIACEKLNKIYSQKLDNEDKIIARAVAEHNAADDLKEHKRREYDEGLFEERKKDYENALEEEKNRKEREREIQNREILNRIKLGEMAQDEEIERQEEHKRRMKEYGEILDEQVEENKRIRAANKAKEDSYKWNDFAEYEYSEETLARQKADEKRTSLIQQDMMEHKEDHELVPSNLKEPVAGAEETDNSKQVESPVNTRRFCPTKNDSSSVSDCFGN